MTAFAPVADIRHLRQDCFGDVVMTKTNRRGWIAAAIGGLFALTASLTRTYLGFWLTILLIGVIAGATAAIGEWRIYRRSSERRHLWGAVGSMVSALLLASYLIGSQ